jgi:hypothetical protein
MARREKRRREILSTKVFRLYLVDDNIDVSCAVKTESEDEQKERKSWADLQSWVE